MSNLTLDAVKETNCHRQTCLEPLVAVGEEALKFEAPVS